MGEGSPEGCSVFQDWGSKVEPPTMKTDGAAEKPHGVRYMLFWRRPQLGCRAPRFALFLQSPQNLKSDVLSFTKSPRSVHFTHSISSRKSGRGQNQIKIYFVTMRGYHLLVTFPSSLIWQDMAGHWSWQGSQIHTRQSAWLLELRTAGQVPLCESLLASATSTSPLPLISLQHFNKNEPLDSPS